MTNMLNIGSAARPLFIDAADVTAVHVLPDRKELGLYNAKGQMLWINYEQWPVDVGTLADKIAAAGNPLVSLPVRYDGHENPHYIAPSAVTFVTVSEPGKNGNHGVIVGVKGAGREESNDATPAELKTLLDAVKATGAALLEFEPEVAHARWSFAQKLYIDPASVTEIRDDGSQVMVSFDGCGSLDVQTRVYDGKDNQRFNELLGKIWKERGQKDDDLQATYEIAKRIEKETLDNARTGFAETIAAANGTLTAIGGSRRPLHVRPSDFAYVTFYDDDRADTPADYKYMMMLERQKAPDNPYAEGVRAYFNSAAKRQEAFETFTRAQTGPRKKPGLQL